MRETARLFCLIAITLLLASPLGAQSQEVKRLMRSLSYSLDSGERAEAAWELGQVEAFEAISVLADALQDKSSMVRANAAASLWSMADAAESAEPALRMALNDRFPGVVANAAGALRQLGVPFDELAPAYWNLLDAQMCRHRIMGLRGLVDEVPPAEIFSVALDCADHCGSADDRSDARSIMRQLLAGNDRTLVPLILDGLSSPGDSIQVLIDAIGEYDPPIAAAVPLLENLMSNQEPEIRKAGADSLGSMMDMAIPALVSLTQTLLTDPHPGVRVKAAKAISDMGKSAEPAVPALIEAIKNDQWPDVRSAAMEALGEMREVARDAIPVLDKTLEDPDSFMRTSALNALFRIDSDNSEEYVRKARRPPATAANVSSKLFEDVTGLKETLVARLPVVYKVVVYTDYAMVTAPEPTAPSGIASFILKNGAVIRPEDSFSNCDKTFRLADIDFSVLPRIVREALDRAGSPTAEVSHVTLSPGLFCGKTVTWEVILDGFWTSTFEFKLDGKLKKGR
jgi:HEAT repeat protein